MTVLTCPHCDEEVTVPTGAEPDAKVRCPLCCAQYPLSDALTRLPPELIVVESMPGRMEAGGYETGADADVDVNATYELHPEPFSIQQVVASSSSRGYAASKRPRRKRKNPTVELVKIVLGGVVAIPLALVILWWLPGNWQRNPLNIANSVGRVVPWIVPENLRSKSKEVPEPDSSLGPELPGGSAPSTTAPGFRSSAGTAGPREGWDTFPDRAEPRLDPFQPANSAISPNPTQPPVPAVGVRNVRQMTAADLAQALQAAREANDALDASAGLDDEVRRQFASDFYRSFARLGEVVTFVNPTDEKAAELVESVRQVLLGFARQYDKLAMIGNGAAGWLAADSRATDGVLLVGTVKEIHRQGLLFETRLELWARDKQRVSVMSRVNPEPYYGPDSNVLVLGALVVDPTANLAGYSGDESLVVMGGYPVVLPKERGK